MMPAARRDNLVFWALVITGMVLSMLLALLLLLRAGGGQP